MASSREVKRPDALFLLSRLLSSVRSISVYIQQRSALLKLKPGPEFRLATDLRWEQEALEKVSVFLPHPAVCEMGSHRPSSLLTRSIQPRMTNRVFFLKKRLEEESGLGGLAFRLRRSDSQLVQIGALDI